MMFWVLLSTTAVIAPSLSLPTRTEQIEENDYRLPLYREDSRRPGERQLDTIEPQRWYYVASEERPQVDGGENVEDEQRHIFVRQTTRMDPLGGGGGHLLRDLETLRHGLYPRKNRAGQTLDSLSGISFGTNKRLDTLSGMSFGAQKRNFDEIDRSGFNSFIKRNFDEIDRSGFNSFVKKNFDEIDRSGFNSFVKRSTDSEGPTH